jgi:hypothetical protein
MENITGSPTADEASAALDEAEASRARLAGRIALPSWFYTSLGVAIAAQIATTAIGLGGNGLWGLAALMAGLVLFFVVAGVQLARFRRRNGVWLAGFASRVVLGTGYVTSATYALALGIAIWAALDELWALTILSAIAGGAAYALGGRRWVRAYRREPATYGPGESAAWLAVLGLLALAGLALLVIQH